jgi:antitoxin (DNA-binding transcriptional repressor) of toxin-antitoxin stability system
MKRASVADLRNKFARISKWIEAGEVVEITKRGRAFATLKSAKPRRQGIEWPDLEARLRSVWPEGIRGKPVSEIIDESQGDY